MKMKSDCSDIALRNLRFGNNDASVGRDQNLLGT
jgi:hypothetical protein